MKSILRFLLGIVSSALLAVGLVRAADQLDPMSQSLPAVSSSPTGSTPSCGNECFFTSTER